MNKTLSSFLALGALFSSVAFANATCQLVHHTPVEGRDKVYTFQVTSTCVINTSKNHIGGAKDAFLLHLTRSPNQLHDEQHGVAYKNTTATKLDITEKFPNEYGSLDIRSTVFVTADQNEMIAESASHSIDASGENKNTQDVKYTLTVKEQSSNQVQIVLFKSISVKKPFIAPGGIFTSKVEERLEQEVNQTVNELSSILPASM